MIEYAILDLVKGMNVEEQLNLLAVKGWRVKCLVAKKKLLLMRKVKIGE